MTVFVNAVQACTIALSGVAGVLWPVSLHLRWISSRPFGVAYRVGHWQGEAMKTILLICTLALCATAIYCVNKQVPAPRHEIVTGTAPNGMLLAFQIDRLNGDLLLWFPSEDAEKIYEAKRLHLAE